MIKLPKKLFGFLDMLTQKILYGKIMIKKIYRISYYLKISQRHLDKILKDSSIEISKPTDISILILPLVPLQALFCQITLFRTFNINQFCDLAKFHTVD